MRLRFSPARLLILLAAGALTGCQSAPAPGNSGCATTKAAALTPTRQVAPSAPAPAPAATPAAADRLMGGAAPVGLDTPALPPRGDFPALSSPAATAPGMVGTPITTPVAREPKERPLDPVFREFVEHVHVGAEIGVGTAWR